MEKRSIQLLYNLLYKWRIVLLDTKNSVFLGVQFCVWRHEGEWGPDSVTMCDREEGRGKKIPENSVT